MSELSLPAKAYLLACDIERGRLRDRQRVALLVRAAALTDLGLRGRIIDRDGRPATADGTGSTGDLVLDDLLAEIGADPHRRWRSWIRRDARATLQSAEAQLSAAGVVEIRTSRALGLFPVRRPVVQDRLVVLRLHALVDDAVRGQGPVSEVDSAIAALTALLAAVEVNSAVSRGDRRRHRARLDQLGERAGAAVPALRKVFRELRSARAAAIASSSGGGGG